MKLIKAVPVEPCGIKLLALLQRKDKTWYTREHKWGKVNHHLATVLNPTLEELADHGAIVVYTYGIRVNRPIRNSTRTSTHSNGLHSNGYKHWRDGSVGALGIDIRKVLFRTHMLCPICLGDGCTPCNETGFTDGSLQTSIVVTDPHDHGHIVQWLERRGWKLYHKKMDSVTPYHLHLQPRELGGVL